MAVIGFNTNIPALGVQRRLGESSKLRNKSFERLATGLRINRASDDAAGLAIADQLKLDQRLYNSAIRNANDGIALLNIVNGSLQEQSNTLIRLIELAEQSANGTLSNTQRSVINREYQALLTEIGRIGDTTSFNGLNALISERSSGKSNGLNELLLQVGINGNALSQLSIDTADTGTFSGTIELADAAVQPNINSGLFDSRTFSELESYYGASHLAHYAVIDSSGVKRELIIGVAVGSYINGIPPNPDLQMVSFNIYQKVADTGGVGAQSGAGIRGDVLDAEDEWVYGGRVGKGYDPITGLQNSTDPLNIILAFDTAGSSPTATLHLDMAGLLITDATGSVVPTSGIPTAYDFTGIETATRALAALTILKARLQELGKFQGEFGASQSRLETMLNVLSVSHEGSASAESRIRDVDVAEESSTLIRTQILQQAGTSILSRANLQPAVVLNLLTSTSR